MRKILSLLGLLLLFAGGVVAQTYVPTNRVTSLETGKKYMIFNTTVNGVRYGFVYANGTSIATDISTVPESFTTGNANYLWELEEGYGTNTYYIKNIGSETYAGTGSSMMGYYGAAEYTLYEFSACPSKAASGGTRDDADTTTPMASITSANKVWCFYNSSNYWNGTESGFTTYSAGQPFAIYEVAEYDVPTNVNIGYQYGTYYRWANSTDCQENNPGSAFSGTSITGGQSSAWSYKWVSASTPTVTLQVSESTNNFNSQTNAFAVGQNSPSTWTFSVDGGYVITGWYLRGTSDGSIEVTPTGGEAVTFASGTENSVTVTGLSSTTATFTMSGGNKAISPAEFYVTVKLPRSTTVTYIALNPDGTEEARLEDVEVTVGETISELPSSLKKDFGVYESSSITTTTEGPNVFTARFTGEYNLPFTASTEGNETWYMLATRGGSYIYANGTNLPRYTSLSTRNANTRFAFIGNPADGFTIKNEGTNNYVTVSSNLATGWSWKAEMGSGITFKVLEADGGFYITTKDLLNTGGSEAYMGYCNGTWLGSGQTYGLAAWGKSGFGNDAIFKVYEVGLEDLTQLSNDKCYYLTVPRGSLAVADGSLKSTMKGYTAGKFALINYEEKLYLWSVDDSKFIVGTGEESELPTSAISFTGDAPFLAKLGDNYINVSSGYTAGVVVNSTSAPDEGNIFAIKEAGTFDPTAALALLDAYFHPATLVNYVIVDENGNELARLDGQYAEAGDEVTTETMPSSLKRDFCSYEGTALTVAEGTNTFTATATWTMPFAVSENFDDATWLYLTVRSANQIVYLADDDTDNIQTTTTEEDDYASQWAFVGNPYDGFTIYNRAAGSGLVLGSEVHDRTASGNSGGTTHVSMQASGSQTEEKFFPEASTYYTNGFFLTNSAGQGLNWRNTTTSAGVITSTWIAYWLDGKDEGSTFVVTDIDANFYDRFVEKVYPYVKDPNAVGTPFNISAAGLALIQNKLIEVSTSNYVNRADCNTLISQVQSNILFPTDGFYRVKNVSNGKYMRAITYAGMNDTGAILVDHNAEEASYDVANVIEVRTDADGHQRLVSNNAYLCWVYYSSYGPVVTSSSTDKYVNFACVAPGIGTINIPYAQSTSGSYYNNAFYGLNGEKVIGTTASNATAQWTFEPATSVSVKMNSIAGDHAYATFYAPFPVRFSGATAYTVTRGEEVEGVGNKAVVEEVTDVVPAGTPVVLIADEGTASCEATIVTGEEVAALTAENILSGHYFEGTVEDGSLVFGKSAGKAGFYKYNDYTTKLGANKAFIAPETTGSTRALVFGLVTTGINALESADAENAYDLQGRRVSKAEKGLYILGGKKVLVK